MWWDPNRFDWDDISPRLAIHCSDHFLKWWNPDKYNWTCGSWALAEYCSQHFSIWWDPLRFNQADIDYLERNCVQYKHIWERDIRLSKLLVGS